MVNEEAYKLVPCLKTLIEEATEGKRQPKHIAMLRLGVGGQVKK